MTAQGMAYNFYEGPFDGHTIELYNQPPEVHLPFIEPQRWTPHPSPYVEYKTAVYKLHFETNYFNKTQPCYVFAGWK